ncbi:carbohydrate kinase [Micromonospora soli]|uniref:carbohydrate kinase family protein n=1 Tax=Micromonospora sp. NBRC 110009 TaxID=3061627 RepID=UPI0026729801|nr:carbohydrate kinase [Micromonospora sp. NBRC 110009]WKT98274.1 carbohydrate kinase [Micromonospora sp. NBRC 110009]
MITVVGESLVDLIEEPADGAAAYPGGSPANVAVALARLGQPTTLLTQLGDDAYGRLVRAHLAASGVRLDPASVSDLPRTSVARTRVGADGQARYDFAIDWPAFPAGALTRVGAGSDCLHTGSLATVLDPGAGDVVALVRDRRAAAMISFDPNCRPSLTGDPVRARHRVEELVAVADLVKVSREDLDWLHPEQPPDRVAQGWLELGAGLVVVTLGAEGALAVTRQVARRVAARPVTVVDTVGAGDAFTAGLLAALRDRGLLGADRRGALRAAAAETLAAVLDDAARVAALTCARRGADPPTRAELAALPAPA